MTKYSVLIVDDEKLNIEVLTRILKPSYNIYIARSGESALKRIKEVQVDIILLDIIMPDMSGFDVLLHLKADDETKDIPVIFITGLDSSEDEAKAFRLGAVDYIKKPFQNIIVECRVKNHVRILHQIRTIEKLSMVDSLTEIPNRRSHNQFLKIEWNKSYREKTPTSLLMIDIDNFKLYNDQYGHPQGDKMLFSVAQCITQSLTRRTDHAARYGGEEFVVTLSNTNLCGALEVAEKIHKNIREYAVAADDSITYATVSIGVFSAVPCDEYPAKSYLEYADRALYTAKNNGRNAIYYYDIESGEYRRFEKG